MSTVVSPHTAEPLVRISTAVALELGLAPGRFYRDSRPGTANILLDYPDGCHGSCAYCGLARGRRQMTTSFIRVAWPVVPLTDLITRLRESRHHLRRVCLAMVSHPWAVMDTLRLATVIKKELSLPVSVLLSAPVWCKSGVPLEELKRVGVDRADLALDAATPELYRRIRRGAVGGGAGWEGTWELITEAVTVFGFGHAGVHLIAGLGESEREMVHTIQQIYDAGAVTHLFSFYPEAGSVMEHETPPPLASYRRVQLARYLIDNGMVRVEAMDFDANGKTVGFGMALDSSNLPPRAFMTAGCPGMDNEVACNRPFANERPSEPFRNYPFYPDAADMAQVAQQIGFWED